MYSKRLMRRLCSVLMVLMLSFGLLSTGVFAAEAEFEDVPETHWAAEEIQWACNAGVLNGFSAQRFAPEEVLTRGMVVTMLHRLAGEPGCRYTNQFSDVTIYNWYGFAVEWAVDNNIANGYGNGGFGPNDPISREQLVTILWRYAQYRGYDVSVGEDTNILSYEDAFDISEFAIPAMQWACGSGLVQGYEGNLSPFASATRAEASRLLFLFCELYEA